MMLLRLRRRGRRLTSDMLCVSPCIPMLSSGKPRRGRHECRPDRIVNAIGDDVVDLRQCVSIEFPAHDLGDRIKLIGMPGTPESNAERLLVEHPAYRQMKEALAVILSGEHVEPLDSTEILLQAWGADFGGGATQIAACEGGVAFRAAEKQPGARGAVGKRRD